MRKIKNYEEFYNEEINFKKALTGAALAGSLLLSPITKASTTNTDVLTQQDRIELAEVNNLQTLFSKEITVSGTKEEVFKKVVEKLRAERGRVSVNSQVSLSCLFTFTDVKPDNSNGFTNVTIDITITGNQVRFDFKKIDFFYSGMQPKSAEQQFGDNLKMKSIDALTDLTRKVVPNPYLGNRLGSELQKGKAEINKPPTNFTYQEAINSNSKIHKSFVKSLNNKLSYITNVIK